MNVGIIGTGIVGQTIAAKLAELGHSVAIGTRNVAQTLARTSPDQYGNPPFRTWQEGHSRVKLLDFAGAAAHGEILVNATSGGSALDALRAAGEKTLEGKILVDIANPLDFSKGMPPSLSVCNTDSLGEQIQRAFPGTYVVKTLNTVNAMLMVDPGRLAGGDHHMFVCGNSAEAKQKVVHMLTTWFGWKHVIDLGDITNARATEMLLPIWVRLYGALRTPAFNFKVVQ
jgi:hypothetical protein